MSMGRHNRYSPMVKVSTELNGPTISAQLKSRTTSRGLEAGHDLMDLRWQNDVVLDDERVGQVERDHPLVGAHVGQRAPDLTGRQVGLGRGVRIRDRAFIAGDLAARPPHLGEVPG